MNYEKWYKTHTQELNNKVCVVTGATGGIGENVVKHLLKSGAIVVYCCRDLIKAGARIDVIKKECDSDKIIPVKLDLANFESIEECVEQINCAFAGGVDYLLNIAGVFNIKRTVTVDKHDIIFQTNFLSVVKLTNALLPLLNKHENSRVVCVTSLTSHWTKIPKNDYEKVLVKNKIKVYANTKRFLSCWTMFNKFRNDKYKNVTFQLAHPGISSTNIIRGYKAGFKKVATWFMKVFFSSAKKVSLSVINALTCKINSNWYESCPRIFGVWGKPKLKKYKINTKIILEMENANNIADKMLNKII